MANRGIHTFFVSEKVSNIRWCPPGYGKGEQFVTGSWHGSTNSVKLWRLKKSFKGFDDCSSMIPQCTASLSFNGDISGLEIIKSEHIAASCSSGCVAVLCNEQKNEKSLAIKGFSPILHQFNSGRAAPCTGISIFEKDIAVVGEDGKLNIVDSSNLRCVKTVAASNCALTSVYFIGFQEVLISNRMGVIKLYDLRLHTNGEVASFVISGKDDRKSNYVSCITCHPTQTHIALTGSEEGSLTVWDLRQIGLPASYISSHTNSITSVRFHQTDSSILHTSSESGELWEWSQTQIMAPKSIEQTMEVLNESVNPWLDVKKTKCKINVLSVISDHRKAINSFDSYGSKLICGGDNEAIYLIEFHKKLKY